MAMPLYTADPPGTNTSALVPRLLRQPEMVPSSLAKIKISALAELVADASASTTAPSPIRWNIPDVILMICSQTFCLIISFFLCFDSVRWFTSEDQPGLDSALSILSANPGSGAMDRTAPLQ